MGTKPDISEFQTSGHIDHQMSSPVLRTAAIVRLADSLIIITIFNLCEFCEFEEGIVDDS